MRPLVARTRHDVVAFRAFGLDAGPLGFAPPQPPGWDALVTLRSGVAALRTPSGFAFLSPREAVLLAAGTTYELDLRTRCAVRIAYLVPKPQRPSAQMLATTELLHALLDRAVRRGYLDPAKAKDARVIALAYDEIAGLAPARADAVLALPRDPFLRRALEAVRADDERAWSVAALAEASAMSVRTFERRFLRETGSTPRAWLRASRLGEAAAYLASGSSVTEAGLASGYASTSAFVTAYRTAFGTTPGRARAASGA